ncbi:MAG: LytTR family DNA-binding domain-containing protein [Lachnospiraceae bacterium]|nr:LytTR family DNA-binding domain-containing protein [Lachnospiraceae bacterium]
MKLTLHLISEGEEEVIIRYRKMTPQVEAIAEIVRGSGQRIPSVWEGQTVYVEPEGIYYLENVDGVTYAYLRDKVVKVPASLKTLEMQFANRGFFRCAKAMILNIHKIRYLKSEPGNRIRATMENGEQVIISRKYAGELRRVLKGGGADAE